MAAVAPGMCRAGPGVWGNKRYKYLINKTPIRKPRCNLAAKSVNALEQRRARGVSTAAAGLTLAQCGLAQPRARQALP
jgi:hypothetical protein